MTALLAHACLNSTQALLPPQVYQGPSPGAGEDAPLEGVLAQDTAAAQDQGASHAGYEQQSIGSSGVHYGRQPPPLHQQVPQRQQQQWKQPGLLQVGGPEADGPIQASNPHARHSCLSPLHSCGRKAPFYCHSMHAACCNLKQLMAPRH